MCEKCREPILCSLMPEITKKGNSEQEISDNAFASCGRILLAAYDSSGNKKVLRNLDFDELFAPPMAPAEDWECLAGDNPDLYARLAVKAAFELERQGIDAPFTYTEPSASIHSLDEARARRQDEDTTQYQTQVQPLQSPAEVG